LIDLLGVYLDIDRFAMYSLFKLGMPGLGRKA
jgi:hypothetical protein